MLAKGLDHLRDQPLAHGRSKWLEHRLDVLAMKVGLIVKDADRFNVLGRLEPHGFKGIVEHALKERLDRRQDDWR